MANEDIEAFERATRRSRSIKLTILILAVLSPLIWVIYKNVDKRQEIAKHEEEYAARMALTAADKKRMDELLPSTIKMLTDQQKKFTAAVTPAALDALEDADTPCMVRTPGSFQLYKAGQPIDSGIGYKLARLGEIETKYKAGKADKNELEQLERLNYLDTVLFVVGEKSEPIVLSNEYMPGSITGFAYLYSYRTEKIACFASFAVQNAASISVEYRAQIGNVLDEEMKKNEAAQAKLAVDLVKQAGEAIDARLHATL